MGTIRVRILQEQIHYHPSNLSGTVAMGTIRVRILQDLRVSVCKERMHVWQWVRSELGYCKNNSIKHSLSNINEWQWVRSELGYCKFPPPCVQSLVIPCGNGYDPS